MTTKNKEVNITAPCVGITRKGDEVLLLPNANRETRDAYPWVYDCGEIDIFEITSRGRMHIHIDDYMMDDLQYDIVDTRPAVAEDFEKNIEFVIGEYSLPPVLGSSPPSMDEYRERLQSVSKDLDLLRRDAFCTESTSEKFDTLVRLMSNLVKTLNERENQEKEQQ